MIISPISSVTAYVQVPVQGVTLEEGTGVGQFTVPVADNTEKSKTTVDNSSVNSNSAELISQVSKQYSYKSPIARLKESNTNTEKTKESNETEKSEFNIDEEDYSVAEVQKKKVNSGYIITMPAEHLNKVAANSKIDDLSYKLQSMFNPSLRTRAGSLVNLML